LTVNTPKDLRRAEEHFSRAQAADPLARIHGREDP
jgi:hypothetical protein